MQVEDRKIAERAYQLWEARGKPEGLSDEIWLEAERELKAHPAPRDAGDSASEEKWHAVGIDPSGPEPSDTRNPDVPEKLVRR
jgi:Protein of unknown function (DUF2934)